jgi:uncharacterized protein YeaO (DUF488 family)
MIKTKRVYEPASNDDGRRILVDRLWPRGIKKETAKIDEWMMDIAPSNDLRKWFAHDPAKWSEFKERYTNELKNKRELVEKLKAEIKKGTVTFLFAAKDAGHNNAVALKELIEL